MKGSLDRQDAMTPRNRNTKAERRDGTKRSLGVSAALRFNSFCISIFILHLCLPLFSGEEQFLARKLTPEQKTKIESEFKRELDAEKFAQNPFLWNKDRLAKLKAEEEARRKKAEEKARARRKAFESYIEDEWISGAPNAAIKEQRALLR
ncbi:hypothetical protein HYR69_01235, partial [Candidatus Sumerlaeota bacterium]|nr:hypothetical protein [Candidatus Sumerlaeota bacterium]